MTACGIFLPVWDTEAKSLGLPYDRILRMTKGGPPHITLFYSGRALSQTALVRMTQNAGILSDIVGRQLVITGVRTNTFAEAAGMPLRTDVLLTLSRESTALIDSLRATLLEYVPLDAIEKLGMVEPHITHTVTYDAAQADSVCQTVAQQLASGPVTVTITGVTFD